VPMVRQDLGRVLINIVGNAFDSVYAKAKEDATYTPAVWVSTRRERGTDDDADGDVGGGAEGRGDRVLIEIRDNGPGVAPEDRPRIFEPFFTTKPTGQGTGLGLSMAYDIVTSGHGGTLECVETEGGGVMFVVGLNG